MAPDGLTVAVGGMASVRCRRSIRCGKIARRHGPSKAPTDAARKPAASTCQTLSDPVSVSAARPAKTTAPPRAVAIRSWRRSALSAATPPASPRIRDGTKRTKPRNPSWSGEPVRSNSSQDIATIDVWRPEIDSALPAQNRRKSRWAREAASCSRGRAMDWHSHTPVAEA